MASVLLAWVGMDLVARAAGAPIWRSRCHARWCEAIAVGEVNRARVYLWLFPFPLPLPLPLPAPFPKPLTDPFSEPWSEPFSDPFSEPLGVEFSFAFVFARDVEWRAIGKLTFTFTLVSTWWGSNGVW